MIYRALFEVILIKVSFDIQSISYCNQRITCISDIPSTSCSHLYTSRCLDIKNTCASCSDHHTLNDTSMVHLAWRQVPYQGGWMVNNITIRSSFRYFLSNKLSLSREKPSCYGCVSIVRRLDSPTAR